MYVCICKAVTEREILAARELGAETPEAIAECLGAGAGCGRCREAVSDCLMVCGAGEPSRQMETEAA